MYIFGEAKVPLKEKILMNINKRTKIRVQKHPWYENF